MARARLARRRDSDSGYPFLDLAQGIPLHLPGDLYDDGARRHRARTADRVGNPMAGGAACPWKRGYSRLCASRCLLLGLDDIWCLDGRDAENTAAAGL